MSITHPVPLVLAGPILRRVTATQITLWLVTSTQADFRLELHPGSGETQSYDINANTAGCRCLTLSPSLHYQLINLQLTTPLPLDCRIDYRLELSTDQANPMWQDITELMPHLLYPNQTRLHFYLPGRVNSLLHGSCRKPHFDSPDGTDGLVEADNYLQSLQQGNQEDLVARWPSMLMMSGDQIYADDVAGPMLHGIHQLSSKLNFPDEHLQTNSDEGGKEQAMTSEVLYQHPDSYYGREHLLPSTEEDQNLVKVLFGGARKPVFTSTEAQNHLITLGEYLACYLLSWSPTPWKMVSLDMPDGLDSGKHEIYNNERKTIEQFIEGLPAVQRVMAHLPVAMIMDDHDITDDFNLHRHWEETVYNHPLSRRMIGSGLLAYLVNQAWGNKPEAFGQPLLDEVQQNLLNPNGEGYDVLIDKLIELEAWDFDWNTNPPLIVLDTRTRRWRSETSATQPSGLLDWEALTDLQRRLRGRSAVLLVSAAPIFGVKLIEVLQRIVTFFGHPLAVDAEYWMAHPGTAHGILNVFCHRKTPQYFVVLSGDVHYSFVYDIELRGRHNSPEIWQICSSGIRNTFPDALLEKLDKLNRWLYSPRSPLNWLTSRRKMRITPRKPIGAPSGRRLLNHSGIGLVELDELGRPIKISQLIGADRQISFEGREDEASWH